MIKVRFASGAIALAVTAALSVVHVTATEAPPSVLRALEAQQQMVRDQPSNAAARNDLGNLLVLAGEQVAAEGAYRHALELAPNLVSARFNLALLLQQRGDGDAAVSAFQDVLSQEPEHAWALYQLGVDLEQRGERQEAVDHYARAFAYDPSLTFADNNPHIIENQLMTQALLRAKKYTSRPGAQVPRQYGDADRIANLILMDEMSQAQEQEDETPQPQNPLPATEGEGNTFFDEEDDAPTEARVLFERRSRSQQQHRPSHPYPFATRTRPAAERRDRQTKEQCWRRARTLPTLRERGSRPAGGRGRRACAPRPRRDSPAPLAVDQRRFGLAEPEQQRPWRRRATTVRSLAAQHESAGNRAQPGDRELDADRARLIPIRR